MKKLLAALCCLSFVTALTVGAVGCGDKKVEKTTTTTTTAGDKDKDKPKP